MTFDKEIFAQRLTLLRQKRNLTMTKLGAAIGVAHQLISRWEKAMAAPTIENLYALASFFNVDSDYLIGRKDVSR